MPLQPNIIERQLIRRGTIPGILLDVGVSAFKQGAVIAAMELGVFDELEEGPLGMDELADRTEAAPEGIEILVQALIPLGYVERDDGTVQFTKAARRSLPEHDLQLMAVYVKENVRYCLDAAQGIKDAPEDGIYGWEHVQSGEIGRSYQETMRWLASDMVDEAVDRVSLPDGAERMLDVGGSHGLYTVRFCEEHPGLNGTVLDWEIGLDAARNTLEDSPDVAERIDLVERDFEKEALPDGYDFAFLGQIVHGLTAEGNRELFGKLSQATTDRGMVAILDQVADPPASSLLPFNPLESSFADGIAALLGLNLFLFSGGRAYAYDDLEQWLSEAGFSDVSYEPLRQSPGYSLVIAEKPGHG